MRQLTEQEHNALELAYGKAINSQLNHYPDVEDFNFAFIAGLSYQDKRIEALEAFIAGKITRDELERITK